MKKTTFIEWERVRGFALVLALAEARVLRKLEFKLK